MVNKKEKEVKSNIEKEVNKDVEKLQKELEALKNKQAKEQEKINKEKEKIKSEKMDLAKQKSLLDEKNNSKKISNRPDKDELIMCKSCVQGTLCYVSKKTGLTIIWEDMDSEEYIEFGELITMKSSQSSFFKKPFIIIEDQRVIDYLKLDKIYGKVMNSKEIEELFSKDIEIIKNELNECSQGVKNTIGEKAREMIKEQTLYDTRVINVLEKELNIELKIIED